MLLESTLKLSIQALLTIFIKIFYLRETNNHFTDTHIQYKHIYCIKIF